MKSEMENRIPEYKKQKAMIRQNNPEIWAYRNRNIALWFLKLTALEVVTAALVIATAAYPVAWISVVACFGLFLPCVVLKPFRFFKRRWIGVVTDIAVKTRSENTTKVYANDGNFHSDRTQMNFYHYTVTDEKGHTHTFETGAQYGGLYQKDDLVIHMTGFCFPVNLTPKNKIYCPKCKAVMPMGNSHCSECGMPTYHADI